MQSLLLDYLGLAKTGRETRTLVEILPELFLVQGESAQSEGAIVTLRDDAPDVGDDEEGDMVRIRRAVRGGRAFVVCVLFVRVARVAERQFRTRGSAVGVLQ